MSLTEETNPASRDIDALETGAILALMLREERKAMDAVGEGMAAIGRAAEAAAAAVRSGGGVYYAGAGTSGRLGAMDAAEVPPTFGKDYFKAVMAGGPGAFLGAVEGAEDEEGAGAEAARGLSSNDMAVGISASGKTPFVLGFLRGAKGKGAGCWLITCNPVDKELSGDLDGVVELLTGPEILAGSTRLKAATATKVALNMLSTAAMIRLGGVYDGLMVDVVPSNRKLIERAEGIVMSIAGCRRPEAAELLEASDMRPKVAALMGREKLSKEEALKLLALSEGSLRRALGE
jgi:N-acetylmuramic acid 6-phosphate etherase